MTALQSYEDVLIAQAIKKSDTGNILLQRTIDDYGRVTQEKQSLINGSWVGSSATSASEVNYNMVLGNPRNQSWNWVTSIPVNKLALSVYFFAAAPWEFANFSIYVRPYNSPAWTCLASITNQGSLFQSQWGTHNLNYDLSTLSSGCTVYEVRVVADRIGSFGSNITVVSASGTNTNTSQYTTTETTTTTYQYDPTYKANLVKKAIQGSSYDIDYMYDSAYNCYITRAYIDNVTNPTFPGSSQLIKTDYTYDFFGRAMTKKDGLDHETQYSYDNLNRITREYHPVDATAKDIIYYDSQNKVQITDEDGKTTIFLYDKMGHPITGKARNNIDQSEATLWFKEYNSLSRLWKDKDALGNTTTYDYDAADRLITKTYPNGDVERFNYDDRNNWKSVWDGKGNLTKYIYDNSGNILQILQ